MGDANGHGDTNVPMIVGGAGVTGNRTLNVGALTQANLYQTIGLKLKADQSPGAASYRNWNVPVIPNL
jgi:hypothetical protein